MKLSLLVLAAFAGYFALLWAWGETFGNIDALPLVVIAALGLYSLGVRHGKRDVDALIR